MSAPGPGVPSRITRARRALVAGSSPRRASRVVRVARHDDLADVVTRRVAALPGIVETRTMVAFQAFSKRDLDALWDLGE